MADSDVNKVIEEFSHLPPEDKEYVAEIIGKQLIEVKRDRLPKGQGKQERISRKER
jgi:hypothetical protein